MSKRVLIVDDYIDNVMLLQEIVELLDYKTEFVLNGKLAFEAVRDKDFDFVLMDIEMPVMNGFEATEEIRNTLPSPKCNIPIIAISAHSVDFFNDKLKSSGISDFVSKPYTMSKLGLVLAKMGL